MPPPRVKTFYYDFVKYSFRLISLISSDPYFENIYNNFLIIFRQIVQFYHNVLKNVCLHAWEIYKMVFYIYTSLPSFYCILTERPFYSLVTVRSSPSRILDFTPLNRAPIFLYVDDSMTKGQI